MNLQRLRFSRSITCLPSRSAMSHSRSHGCRELRMLDIARIPGCCRLEDKDRGFLLGHRAVLDSPRHDDELARSELDLSVLELHPKSTAQSEEHLVFMFVVMPDERALELQQLDLLPVELADDLRPPVLGDESELRGETDLFHP